MGTTFVDIKGFPIGNYIPQGRNAGTVEFVHGGVGRNVAEDLANLELRPVYVSMTDSTAVGQEVLERLANIGVKTDYVINTSDGLGLWLAVFDETGDLTAAISKRPDMTPMLKMLEEKGDEIFRDCSSVVVEIDSDREVVNQVFNLAEKYGKPVYALVANMTIATERREFIRRTQCFICNLQEAGIYFVDDFTGLNETELQAELLKRIRDAGLKSMVVTLGGDGAVYADTDGTTGFCPAIKVSVRDTTGAGDAFGAGVAAGLTYGKTLDAAVEIGTRLAASTITGSDNVCPRFLPLELGLKLETD